MVWPNLLELDVRAPNASSIVRGSSVPIRYWYDDTDSNATITLRLDRDSNPYNQNSLGQIGQFGVLATGDSFASRSTWSWNTAGLTPGTYFVYGEIADGSGRRRFLYEQSPVTIVAAAGRAGQAPPPTDAAEQPASVSLPDGRLLVGSISDDGRALLFWRGGGGGWSAVDLSAGSATASPVLGVRVWADASNGDAYAAVATRNGLVVYREEAPGVWVSRGLTGELPGASAVVRGLEVFQSRDGRAHVVGINESRDVVLYEQAGGSGRGAWSFVNLSSSVEDRGLVAPVFAGSLVTLVTPWNALNIAGLDGSGSIKAIWKAQGTEWSTADLSASTGAPALAGGLTAFTTSWNAMNFLGADADGNVDGVWWTDDTAWRRTNLTASVAGGAPRLDAASVTSYATPWNAMNIVGRNAAGKVVVYWWTPGTRRWQIAPLSDVIPGSPIPSGPMNGDSSSGGMSVVGTAVGGQLVRYGWEPGEGWRAENLSAQARVV